MAWGIAPCQVMYVRFMVNIEINEVFFLFMVKRNLRIDVFNSEGVKCEMLLAIVANSRSQFLEYVLHMLLLHHIVTFVKGSLSMCACNIITSCHCNPIALQVCFFCNSDAHGAFFKMILCLSSY